MWRVIDLHFSERSIVQHQLDSYNKFTRDIAEVIARHGSFEVRVTPQFDPNMDVAPECVWEFKFTGPVFKSPPSHTNVDKSTERVTPLLCRRGTSPTIATSPAIWSTDATQSRRTADLCGREG